jgi:hypothetical protein
MKKIFFLFALVVSLAGASCKGTPAAEEHNAETSAGQEASQQLAYICPMRCEGSASDKPGKCPVCGMDLEKNPDHPAAAADSAAH